MKSTSSGHSAGPADRAEARLPPRGLFDLLARVLLAAIVICRLLTPTDAAAVGETLWIAQLSLLALVVWAFALYRSEAFQLTLHWVDAAVLLFCLGHITGAVVVVATSGDQRAALNMLWEWCGVAATYALMRWLLVTADERRTLILAVAGAAVSLSGLGIWQHYSGYAESRREYTRLKTELQSLESSGRPADPQAALEWDRAVHDLRAKFVHMGVPTDDGARTLWEARLNSTESIGLFALANTLGGVLACAAVIWLGALIYADRNQFRWQFIIGGILTLALLYCLLLTKSRTALVGLGVGLTAWFIGVRCWQSAGRRRRAWGLAAGVAAAGLVTIAGATGGLDRFVVSESLKSLRYRFEYWCGTSQMLASNSRNWLVGVGPGNFRENYLPFKLARSSEEIADPHNLLLDVWANGGITALLGLVGVCAAGWQPLFKSAGTGCGKLAAESRKSPAAAPRTHLQNTGRLSSAGAAASAGDLSWRNGILAGGLLGHLAVLIPGGGSDEIIILLLLGWLCIVAICAPLFCRDLPGLTYGAAFAALSVHLLGAGGIGMPAIVQLLLLMVILGRDFTNAGRWTFDAPSRWPSVAIGLTGLALYLGCWFTGLAPVYSARAAIAGGDFALIDEGRPDKSEREFRRAAAADPWSSIPCERLAQLSFQRWLASDWGSQEDFDRCLAWQRAAIARNPESAGGYQALGAMHLAKFNRTEDRRDAIEAVDAFRRATARYPNNALLQSELAESLWKAGETGPACDAARRADDLDAINNAAGHADKRLPPARQKLMQRIYEEHARAN